MEPNLGRQAVTSAVAGLTVNPDNVLAVHHAIRAEAKELGDLMRMHASDLRVEPLGADPVSYYATPIFNAKLDAFKQECHGYINALHEVAEQLATVARGYGYTEQQIIDSFDAYVRTRGTPSVGGPK